MAPPGRTPRECSWLSFMPDQDAKVLYVHVSVSELIRVQPGTVEGVDEYCTRELFPLLDQIEHLCLTQNLRQVCSADVQGVHVTNVKPVAMVRMIWNVYEHTKNCILLDKCELRGGDSLFTTLVEAVRGFLPPFMRGMITLIPGPNEKTYEK
jgi:hypothetical protein